MASAKKDNKSLKSILLTELFVPYKTSGVREGFRRLGILLGVVAFVWCYTFGEPLAQYATQHGPLVSLTVEISLALISIIAFLVTALASKAICWVVDGFVKLK